MTVNGSLPDGNYLLRVDTNVKELGSRDIPCANNSSDFFVAAYRLTGESVLSSVEYGIAAFAP